MKQIKVSQSNKPYYTEDFIKGFECGTKTQFETDKEVLGRIKQAREEITGIIEHCLLLDESIRAYGLREARDIIDKLIAESEVGK